MLSVFGVQHGLLPSILSLVFFLRLSLTLGVNIHPGVVPAFILSLVLLLCLQSFPSVAIPSLIPPVIPMQALASGFNKSIAPAIKRNSSIAQGVLAISLESFRGLSFESASSLLGFGP